MNPRITGRCTCSWFHAICYPSRAHWHTSLIGCIAVPRRAAMSEGPASFGHRRPPRLRVAASLSQEELAERSNLSVRGISDLERGLRHAPRLETVRMLADALALRDGDRAALLTAARPGVVRDEAADRARPTPVSLPVPLTRLIGREMEIAALQATLRGDVRLLT